MKEIVTEIKVNYYTEPLKDLLNNTEAPQS